MPEHTDPSGDAAALADAITSGDRRALARAITLVESTRADHRATAEALVDALIPHTGGALRLGISGAPGVGKSTFIETFGLHQVDSGTRVAVLAVDPSSQRSGGSILGDKTRMEQLARAPDAFIRPTPAGTTTGGIARRTREALLLCEAAGFEMVLVETVGVGQAELAVADMTDLFVLLVAPGGGDDLQGIKRGIMELADLVVVTKADGDLAPAARRAVADHKKALQLLRPPHAELSPTALSVSSVTGDGIDAVAERIVQDHRTLASSGALERARAAQHRSWFWAEITAGIRDRLRSDEQLGGHLDRLEADIIEGRTSPVAAARELLARTHFEEQSGS